MLDTILNIFGNLGVYKLEKEEPQGNKLKIKIFNFKFIIKNKNIKKHLAF